MKDVTYGVGLCLIFIFVLYVPSCSGGECCRISTHFLHMWDYEQVWCPVFCCGDSWTALRCCSDISSRAPGHYRDGFCAAWFRHSGHLWIPIVSGLIVLAIIISCIVCCCRVCCVF